MSLWYILKPQRAVVVQLSVGKLHISCRSVFSSEGCLDPDGWEGMELQIEHRDKAHKFHPLRKTINCSLMTLYWWRCLLIIHLIANNTKMPKSCFVVGRTTNRGENPWLSFRNSRTEKLRSWHSVFLHAASILQNWPDKVKKLRRS